MVVYIRRGKGMGMEKYKDCFGNLPCGSCTCHLAEGSLFLHLSSLDI